MNMKKVAAVLAAGVLSTSASAFAADTASSATQKSTKPPVTDTQRSEKSQSVPSGSQKSSRSSSQSTKPELTEAQKAERDQKSAAREQLKAKWAALSTTQKNQVYAIEEKIVALEKEKLDTLVSLGVIDKTTADEQKQKLDERLSSQKSAGEYPSGKGAKGNRSHRQAQSAS